MARDADIRELQVLAALSLAPQSASEVKARLYKRGQRSGAVHAVLRTVTYHGWAVQHSEFRPRKWSLSKWGEEELDTTGRRA